MTSQRLPPRILQQPVSPRQALEDLQIDRRVIDLVVEEMGGAERFNEGFRLDYSIFSQQVGYRQVLLDNGAGVWGLADSFDDIWSQTEQDDGKREFRTAGRVVNDRIRKQQ